jgi:hypothetical protein
MNRAEFAAALESLARAWTEKDYARAAGFFAEDVRYADPLHYRFSSRADLLAFFRCGTTSCSMRRSRPGPRNIPMRGPTGITASS